MSGHDLMTRAALPFGLLALLAASAQAQLPQARLYSVFPPGMQVGATTEITVTGGEDIDELKALHFSHPGLTAAPKMQTVEGQQKPVDNVFVVSAASNVPPGIYEVVAEGRFGTSNPRRFSVGTKTESPEAEPNNEVANATALAINTVVNARMDAATDVDWYKLSAESGQRIVFECNAQSIDSRMSVTLELYDSNGRRIGRARSTHTADAVLAFDAPAAGEYRLKVFDYTFRGGSDYFYRLSAHTAPRIEFALPAAGLPGSSSEYALYGYNLPGGTRSDVVLNGVALDRLTTHIALPADPSLLDADNYTNSVAADVDALSFRLPSPLGPSNAVRIGIAAAPVGVEQEPNNEPAQAQAVTVPAEIDGQFAAPGDADCFTFTAKAGEVVCIETFGERISSHADPYLVVEQVTKDDKGVETVTRLTAQDDLATNLYQNVFDTQTDDAYFRLQAPADATYRVTVRHRAWETEGNPSFVYRLALRRETPDFRVVAVPLAPTPGQPFPIGLRQGDHFAVNLLAFRRDGFTGPITVSPEKLPAGISCSPAVIGPGQNSATLAFTAAADAAPGAYQLPLVARTSIPDAAAVQAVEAAKTAAATATAAVAPLKVELDKANANVQVTTTALDAAKAAAAAKPDDAAIAQAVQLTQQGHDATVAAQQQAAKSVADAEQAAATAVAAIAQAEQVAVSKVRHLERGVRSGTVVWAGTGTAVSRVASAICISVMPEAAPFEVKSDVSRVVLYQGGQLLIPATLEKRNGFDAEVALNFTGLPGNTNIDVANGKFEKGEAAKVLRLFAKENATPGIYTVWLSTTGQVSYARNPERAARLKSEFDAIAVEAKTAADATAAATATRTDAAAKATAATELLTKAQAEKAAADEAAKTTAAALKQAQDAEAAATTQLTEAEAAKAKAEQGLTTAQAVVSDAGKVVEMAEQLVKTAQTALDADAANDALKQQKADSDAALAAAVKARDSAQTGVGTAEQAVATTKAQAEQATAALNEAKKTLAAATEAAKQTDGVVQTETAELATAETASKSAAEAQAAAEKAEQEAAAKSTALEAKRVAAETASNEAAKAATPANKNFTPPSSPIVVEVRAAPVKLAANVPDSGNLKRGASLQIKVTVTRQNGFAGPLTLSLPLPPGATGLSSDTPTIAADQTEGVLTVTAAADAPVGAVANLVVQGSMDFAGTAKVDVPVAITVTE